MTLHLPLNPAFTQNFYDGIEALDPDNGDHVLVCLGGDFSRSNKEELPYRGVDSSYSSRWCGKGTIKNAPNTSTPIEVTSNSYLCDRYSQEEIKQIPHISTNVKAAIDFLSKDDDGFFLMYEQGDVRLWLVCCCSDNANSDSFFVYHLD